MVSATSFMRIAAAALLGVLVGSAGTWRYLVWHTDLVHAPHARSHAAEGAEGRSSGEPVSWDRTQQPGSNIPAERTPVRIVSTSRIRPAFAGGHRQGVLLTNLDRGFLTDIGVEEGDVLLTINGIELDSKRASHDLLDEIARAESIELRLLRADGSEAEIYYP